MKSDHDTELNEAVSKVTRLSMYGFWLGVALGAWIGWCSALAYHAWDL